MRVKEVLAILVVGIVLAAFSVYAASLSDISSEDFGTGTFQRTFYNSSGFVQLNSSSTTGNFTSRIFDAFVNSTWRNITWMLRVCPDCQLPDNRAIENGYAHNLNMTGNVLLVHFNNTAMESASLFKDFSGNGLNGTCITNRCPAFVNNGRFGGAYDFENGGTFDDFVNFTNPSAVNNFANQITLEAWLLPESFDNANNAPTFIDKDFAQQYSYYFTRLSSTTARQRAWLVTSNGIRNVTGNLTLNAGTWYHLVFTYNGSSMRVYANGVIDGILDHTGTINTSTKNLLIGSGWSGTNPLAFPFDGVIDEVAIYNRSLSAEEVMDHYERGVTSFNMSVRTCNDASCIGENFTDVPDLSPQSFSFGQNRYFQYKAIFETNDVGISPALYNLTLQYTPNNTAPLLVIAHPLSQNYSRTNLNLNYSVYDFDGNLDSCWYSVDSSVTNTTIPCGTNVSLTASEGLNNWTVYVNDTIGSFNRSSVSFFVDSILPLISFNTDTPVNGSYLSYNSLYVNTSWTEINFASIAFTLYNSSALVNRTIFTSARTGINWTGLSNGVYFYNVTINDTLGNNNSTETRTVFVDTRLPLINIGHPLNTTYAVSPSMLNYSAIDINLQACWYSLNGGVVNTTIPCGVNVTGLSANQGTNVWSVYSNDSAGNTNFSRVTFVVDSMAPNFTIYSPLNTTYGNNNLSINFTSSDANDISARWFYNGTGNTTYTTPVYQIVSQGSNTFIFYSNDTFGNLNSTNVTFFVDSIVPSISFLSPTDSNNSLVTRSFILVNLSVSDSNLASFTLDLYNSSGLLNQTVSTGAGIFVNYSGLLDGIYFVNASAVDIVGNSNRTETRTIRVDAAAPILTINSPQNRAYTSLPILFNVSVNEDATFCNYSINGALNFSMSSSNSRIFNASNASMADGNYTVWYTCGDLAGNVNSTSVSFRLDRVAPLISLVYPLNTTYSVAPTALNYSVFDEDIQACWYSLDNGASNFSISCGENVTNLFVSPGSHTWSVYANDSGGNTNLTSVTFYFDDSIPLVSFVSPTEAHGANLTVNQIRVNVTALDTNLGTIVLNLYNSTSLVGNLSSDASPLTFTFTDLSDGDYYFNATVNDTLGNFNHTETRHVVIDTTGPSLVLISPQNTTYYSALILVNISAVDANSVWFYNGTDNESYISPVNRTFIEGSNIFVAYANDSLGNMNSASVIFSVNSLNNSPPVVTLNSPAGNAIIPANGSFVADILLNASIADSEGDNMTVWVFGDNLLLASFNVSGSGDVSYAWNSVSTGNHVWNVIAFDGYVNGSDSGNFIVNATSEAPAIFISSPVICSVFGTNEGLSLNLVINSSSLDSCWYSLDSGLTNQSIDDCQSTSFDVALSGDYVLDVYANESLNGLIGHARTSFKVDIDAPTIIVESPLNGTHTNQSHLVFHYFTEGYNGYDTQQCSLLGDFNGTYLLNQTNFSIVSGDSNMFSLNLSEGRYAWGLSCGNALKNTTMMCNYSVVSDVTPPNITLTQPNGTYTNHSVPLIVDVEDNLANMTSEGSCSYNVSLVSGTQVVNATILAACASSVLNNLGDGEYELVLAATDAAGNTRGSNAVFSVSGSSSGGLPGGAGGGGDTPGVTGFARLNVTAPDPFYIKRGQIGTFEVRAVNNGQRFLNQCYLRFSGDFAQYLNASGESSFSSGQSYTYDVDVALSSSVVPGQYSVQGSVVCSDYSSQFALNVVVTPTEFDFRMSNYTRNADLLLVRYSLEELVGRSQTLTINYVLTNLEGDVVTDGSFETSLEPNELQSDVLEVVLPKDAFGEFNLQLQVDNGRESLGVERPVFLSSAGVTGLVISDENRRALTWFAVALFAIIIFILVVRYIYKRYQLAHYHPPRHMHNHHLHHNSHHSVHHHKHHGRHHHAS